MAYTAIVIDSDRGCAESIASIVADCGYLAHTVGTGGAALRMYDTVNPGLLLLELTLPDMDGLDVCRRVRKSSMVPIIVISGRETLIDRVCAFELGADDFVSKPFRRSELEWRIKTLMRTAYGRAALMPTTGPTLNFGDIVISPARREVCISGRPIHLTPKEFDLLAALAQRHDHIISSAWLLLNIWGYDDAIRTRTLDVHINRLRAKLEPDPSAPVYILNTPGVGYTFCGCSHACREAA